VGYARVGSAKAGSTDADSTHLYAAVVENEDNADGAPSWSRIGGCRVIDVYDPNKFDSTNNKYNEDFSLDIEDDSAELVYRYETLLKEKAKAF